MARCESQKEPDLDPNDPCTPPQAPDTACSCSCPGNRSGVSARFGNMVDNSLAFARASRDEGKKIVGILCEYTPRELIMAAGGIPVCLCGGDSTTIPAAENHLPSNLCPLIKSTYGYHLEKSNPFLEMMDLIVAETTCDGKKKMYELLAESIPMIVLELPQKEKDEAGLARWTMELERFREELESRFHVKISDEAIWEAVALMNRERSLRRELAELMRVDSPPLTGRELLDLKSLISGIPADLEEYGKVLKRLREHVPDDPSRSKRVRVLMTGVPTVHGAERVVDLIEDHGGLVVCMENCTGVKPILEDVNPEAVDPIKALAEKYYRLPCSVMTSNEARLDSLRSLADAYRPDCVIELIWQACLTYDVESYRIRRLSEEELDLPYLRIETDYSPSDSARIAVRIEALYETVRENGERFRQRP